MAFNTQELCVIGYGNGFTLWHYRSSGDALSAITAADYFDNASKLLAVGDSIIINDSANTTGMRRVSAVATDDVTIAALA